MPSNVVSISQSNSEFATDLYMAILEKNQDEDVVVSPFFLQNSIALTYAASAGRTEEELARALKLPEDDKSVIGKSFQNVLQKYSNIPVLLFASKIYVKQNAKLKSNFSKIIMKNFFSEVEKINFNDTTQAVKNVNAWVAHKTNEKILGLIDENAISSTTDMVLVSAIYFSGTWEKCFDPDCTETRPFWTSQNESRNVELMFQTGFFKYGVLEVLNASALEMKYSNTDLWMLIILPNERDDLKNLEENLPLVDLLEISHHLATKRVDVYLPKFRLECKMEMEVPLTELGMGSLFSDPDFSNMLEKEEIKVDKFVHKVFVEINEHGGQEGETIALIPMPEMIRSSNLVESVEFKAEHPFFFAIKSDSAILFTGRYIFHNSSMTKS